MDYENCIVGIMSYTLFSMLIIADMHIYVTMQKGIYGLCFKLNYNFEHGVLKKNCAKPELVAGKLLVSDVSNSKR